MAKKFDKALYAENDKVAKEVSLEFLMQSKLYEIKTPLNEQKESFKKYDYVIFHKKNKTPVFIEAEVKRVWTKVGVWEGYETVDVPKRKESSEATYFIMLNASLDTLAYANMSDILSATIGFKCTKYTRNEPFFKVGLDKFKFFHKKEDGKWKQVK